MHTYKTTTFSKGLLLSISAVTSLHLSQVAREYFTFVMMSVPCVMFPFRKSLWHGRGVLVLMNQVSTGDQTNQEMSYKVHGLMPSFWHHRIEHCYNCLQLQVMLKQTDGSYACVAEAAERFTLGQTKEELLVSLGLQEEVGSTMEFLRRGYKTSTWWEEDKELEESSAWRT